MNAEPSSPLWVCVDCYLTHAGYSDEEMGIDPTQRDDIPLSLIPEGVEVSAGMLNEYHECARGTDPFDQTYYTDEEDACDCERIEFTWSACDGCGSHLGGSRDALTLWYPPST